jgi:hypothetical protein
MTMLFLYVLGAFSLVALAILNVHAARRWPDAD